MTMSITNNASQATQIEQARAIAEVLASVQAAHDHPRDEDVAVERFMRSCARMQFAERAFWRFPRAKEQLTGPTIDFALEALRCWGNTTSGSAELVRRATESEMVAFAWDLETNSARRTTFVNPHTGYTDTPFDRQGNPTPVRTLVAVRDIRENNQSAGSRVEREMILAALPAWYVEMGKAKCYETLRGDGKVPIDDRRRAQVEWFAEKLGVRREELVAKIGAPVASWVDADLATLRVVGAAIRRGESTVAAEFRSHVEDAAAPRVGAAALATAGASTPSGDSPQAPAPAPDGASVDTDPEPPQLITKPRQNELFALMNGAGLTGKGADVRARRVRLCQILTGRDDIASSSDLWMTEGEALCTTLRGWGESAQEVVALLLAEDAAEQAAANNVPADAPAPDVADADAAVEASGDDA